MVTQAKIDIAVERLRTHAPKEGTYVGCFSGGKDSVVIREIGRMSGLPIEWHYHQTTIDPPELVRFIMREHPDVKWDHPKIPFFAVVPKRGLPTRIARWCCEAYKESRGAVGSRLILGVRWEESPRRAKNWGVATYHKRSKDYAISPIVDWTHDDVWGFIRTHGLKYCSLYDEGFKRLGCIGCPMGGRKSQEREFARWPRFEVLWKKACRRAYENRLQSWEEQKREDLITKWPTWEHYWRWWLTIDEQEQCQGVLDFFS